MTPAEIRRTILELKEGTAESRVKIEGIEAQIEKLERRLDKAEETLAVYRERLALLNHDRAKRDVTADSGRNLKRDLIVAGVNIVLGAIVAYVVAKKS